MRYHKIAESPKINHDLAEPERHRYSELDVVNEALRELLWRLDEDQHTYLSRDKAYVALKLLYRLEEHHKMAQDGRPKYPPFSWALVDNFAKTPPFTDQEYSTPLVGGGKKPGQAHRRHESNPTAPATPTKEDN